MPFVLLNLLSKGFDNYHCVYACKNLCHAKVVDFVILSLGTFIFGVVK